MSMHDRHTRLTGPVLTLHCDRGHTPGFRMMADGSLGEFTTGEVVVPVARGSHAYTHGGCCYRAAQDALAGRDASHD